VSSGRRGIATKPCVLRAAVDLGVNHIDTAQYHGPGAVNDLLGEALYPYPNDLAIVSKVAVRRDIADPVSPFGEQHERRQGIEDNLATLGTSRLAAVNLRMMDPSAPPRSSSRRTPATRSASTGRSRGPAGRWGCCWLAR
jgi:aryl-alcohol dehydrogenase-like predicted oxidoreductase